MSLPKLVDAILINWQRCLEPPYGTGEFSPADGQTDCNRFVSAVSEYMGYDKLKGLRANQIFDLLSASDDWLKVSSETAGYLANHGYLVVAAWKNPDANKSGHVAVVRPGEPIVSEKWGYRLPQVPKVANVGKAERCKLDQGANWAFAVEPSYFSLKGARHEGS